MNYMGLPHKAANISSDEESKAGSGGDHKISLDSLSDLKDKLMSMSTPLESEDD